MERIFWQRLIYSEAYAKISRLSDAELRAYMTMWLGCGMEWPMPADSAELARNIGSPKEAVDGVLAKLGFMFEEVDGNLRHVEVYAAVKKHTEISRKRAEAGRKGGRPRVNHDEGHSSDPEKSNCLANEKQLPSKKKQIDLAVDRKCFEEVNSRHQPPITPESSDAELLAKMDNYDGEVSL